MSRKPTIRKQKGEATPTPPPTEEAVVPAAPKKRKKHIPPPPPPAPVQKVQPICTTTLPTYKTLPNLKF